MAFERYVAEEVATDAADGHISRREALRRLALLGFTVPAATALLAAFGVGDARDDTRLVGAVAPPSPAGQVAAGPPAEAVTFAAPDGAQLTAAFAAATGTPKGNVLVIHENKGLTDHFRNFPLRLSADGYHALAIDLLSRDGGTASFADPAAATAALSAAPRERLVADALAGVGELLRRAPDLRVGAMGFCFGGGMSWSLVASGDERLAAVIPFYGTVPEGADFSRSKAAVLGVYAELDARVNGTRDAATALLVTAGLTHEIKTYPGVDHAFFNETGTRYNAAVAGEAYQAVLGWFGRHVARAASLPVTH